MGRGKRQQGSARPADAVQAVFALPPWPQDAWAKPGMFVTERRLRDVDDLAAFAEELSLSSSLADAQERGVAAVASGESFDNAMGTDLFADGQMQELSLYLTVDGLPAGELNLASLCAWASAPYRGGNAGLSSVRLQDATDLAAFADEHELRPDWHEPDEQEVAARVRGRALDRSPDALVVEFCRREYDPATGDYSVGTALAEVTLVDLLAWALGWERPESSVEAGPRLRPSGLASRLD